MNGFAKGLLDGIVDEGSQDLYVEEVKSQNRLLDSAMVYSLPIFAQSVP